MPELVFMLTRDDRTVDEPLRVYESVRHLPLRHVGFKDVGSDPETLRELAARIRADGRTAYLEVVAPDRAAELEAIHAAAEIGVDAVMGGTQHDEALALLRGTELAYWPFPGTVEGHPSRLTGSLEAIVGDARRLASTPGVAGLDLLAYRWTEGEGRDLARAVCAAVSAPVIVAGSIDSASRVRAVGSAGAWGLTVGSAAFAGRFGPGALADQVAAVLAIAAPGVRPAGAA